MYPRSQLTAAMLALSLAGLGCATPPARTAPTGAPPPKPARPTAADGHAAVHSRASPAGQLRGEGPASAPQLRSAWQTTTAIRSVPAWTGQRMVVVSTGGVLHGLATDTLPAWTLQLDAHVVGLGTDGLGSLRIATRDGRVVAVSELGQRLWSHALGATTDSAPVIGAGATTYVLADGLHALDRDGLLLWHVPRVGARRAGPLLLGELVIFGTQHGEIVAVDAQGSPRWTLHVGASVDNALAAGSDGDILVGTDLGDLHSISAAGKLRWSVKLGGRITAPPSVGPSGQIAVVSNDHHLYYLDRSGSLLWRFRAAAPLRARPTIDAAGSVLLGGRDNNLYLIDRSGQPRWQTNVGHAIGTPVVASPDGRLYVGTDGAQLLTLQERNSK